MVIKDGGRRIVTERGAVMKMFEWYFKEVLNREGSNGKLELPCYVKGESRVCRDHRGGSVDGIEKDEEGKSARH